MADIRARVLIVDDDDRSRAVASSLLRGSSNKIEFAATGGEAIELARTWKPDLILLDVMMPELDGYEVCRRLRADPDIADVRVFMLTALDDSSARLEAFAAGADDFITKPLNRVETLARIQAIARLNRYRDLVRNQRQIDDGTAPGRPEEALLEVERTLADALESVTLWFQPIVARDDGASGILAYEALVRTSNAILTHPAALFAAARKLGRLDSVSAAVRRCLATTAEAHPDITFFLNLNVEELDDESLYALDDVLAPYAGRIVIEITEREALTSITGFRQRVNALRRRGFRIAVDDLGAGFSSLESLVLVEPDFLKMDQSIVRRIDCDPKRRAVVQSVFSLAGELGIAMIVEGVETRSECEALELLGCRLMQGYLFGKPAPEPMGVTPG